MGKYCEQYGFDAARIRERLDLLKLGAGDHPLAKSLHDSVIAPNLEQIVDCFYAEMLSHAAMREYLDSPELIVSLRKTQMSYLLDLGAGFDTDAYFEERLRVGLAHARVGIPLSLYLCAYRILTQLLHDAIPAGIRRDVAACDALDAFLRKITTLDMSLAIDTYHRARMADMQRSIETLRIEENHLRQLANTDALTALANRVAIQDLLDKAMSETPNATQPLWVMMADLDYFKRINDTHGHLVGDSVLREVAQRLRAAVRDIDTVGRYGGEEFLVVLSKASQRVAQDIAERIRLRVAGSPIKVYHVTINVTISIGLTEARSYDTATTLVERADRALYSAKEQGRNRVVTLIDS